jgi:hypothetical protein
MLGSQLTSGPHAAPASPLKTRLGQQVDGRAVRVVVAAAVVMAMGFGVLALTAVFIRPLETEFGWSRAGISFAYAVATRAWLSEACSGVGLRIGSTFASCSPLAALA